MISDWILIFITDIKSNIDLLKEFINVEGKVIKISSMLIHYIDKIASLCLIIDQ